MRKRSMTPLTFFALLTFVLAQPPSSLWGQQQEGNVCEPPKFRFLWLGNSELSLVMTANQTRDYTLKIRPHRSSKGDRAACNALPDQEETTRDRKRAYPPMAMTGSCEFQQEGDWWYQCDIEAVKGRDVELDLNPTNFCLLGVDGLLKIRWELKEEDSELCPSDQKGETDSIVALRRHTFAFDAGPVFSLESDGSYDNGTELAASGFSRWTRAISSFGDIRFSRIGAIDAPMDEDNDMGGDDMSMEEEDAFNPFEEGGNVLSLNAGMLFHPWHWKKTRLVPSFSAVLGGGFTTRPGDASELDARTRVFLGIRAQVARFNVQAANDELAGSSGFLQFGYARDDLWKFTEVRDADGDPNTTEDQTTVEIDETDRWWVEAQLLIPAIGTDNVRLKLRLYADIPTSGDGPSDVRVSALFQFNLTQFASGLRQP